LETVKGIPGPIFGPLPRNYQETGLAGNFSLPKVSR